MEHLDEHTLELYVLGASSVEPRREEIEAHLAECSACLALKEQMAAFYARLEENMLERETAHEALTLRRTREGHAIVRRREDLGPVSGMRGAVVGLRTFAGRHPVAATGTAAFSFAAVVFAALLIVNVAKKNQNPAYYHYNFRANTIEICDREGKELWDLRAMDLEGTLNLERWGMNRTIVSDIDGDGKNEVLTTVPLNGGSTASALKVFRSNSALQFDRSFDAEVAYAGRQYQSRFDGAGVMAVEGGAGKREILVGCINAHSPFYLLRVRADNEVLGQYWHFGYLPVMDTLDVNGDGRPELLLGGVNDTADSTYNEGPALAVLDVSKILSSRASGTAPGFGLARSDAELYYVRFPATDIDSALQSHSSIVKMTCGREGTISVITHSSFPEIQGMEYVLSRDMRVLSVRAASGYEMEHARLEREGRVRQNLGREYFERLKAGVRYWNGSAWEAGPVQVLHGIMAGR